MIGRMDVDVRLICEEHEKLVLNFVEADAMDLLGMLDWDCWE